jgi:transcriptional regulator with XRE-family HTH domain
MTLSDFVKQVMEQNNFGVRDVSRNSGERIAPSHVSKVLNGSVSNLTASKVVALALGLKVDPHEVFAVISGYPVKEASSPDLVKFAELIRQIAKDPVLLEGVEVLMGIDAKDQAKAISAIKFVNKRGPSAGRGKKKG